MQILKVTSIVGAVHFALFVILAQPGCQSIDRAWEEHRAERGTVLAKEQDLLPAPVPVRDATDDLNRVAIAETPLVGSQARFEPSRPPESASVAPDLDNGFINAGIEGVVVDDSGSGAFAPDFGPTEPAFGRTYTVRSGDSLWSIAQREGVSFSSLLEANDMTRETRLRVGQSIVIPDGGGAAPAGAGFAPATAPEGWSDYTVRSGDSLSRLAARQGTTVAEIKRVNGLSGDTIRVGQVLQVPGGAAAAPPPAVPSVGGSSVAASPGDFSGTHTVQPGEYPQSIARLYGMSTSELLQINGITDPTRLRVGQKLKVAATGGVDAAGAPRSGSSKLNAIGGDPSVTVEPSDDGILEIVIPGLDEPSVDSSTGAPIVIPSSRQLEPEPADPADFGFDENNLDEIPVVEIERIDE